MHTPIQNNSAFLESNINKAHYAKRWGNVNDMVNQVTGGHHTLGTGFYYPKPFAVFILEADDRKQKGYSIWRCENGRPVALEKLILLKGK